MSGATPEAYPGQNRLDWTEIGSGLLLFLLLALIKSRDFVLHGRFWAEEGAIFYPEICAAPGLNGLGYIFNHHLEFWTNLGVLMASRVPLGMAPAVTSLYALALQVLPLVLLIAKRQHLGLSGASVLALMIVAVGMPQGREIWANTINLHFSFAILAALILALPATGGRWAVLSILALIACGLSGIPAHFLMPLFVLVACWSRNPVRILQATVLAATALLQIFLLLSSGYDGARDVIPPLDIIALSGLSHGFFTLIWSPIAGRLSAELMLPLAHSGSVSQLIIGAGVVLGALWLIARIFGSLERFHPDRASGRRNTRLVLSAAMLLAASVTLAIGDRANLISSHYGGRYFFAPNMLVAILLLSRGAPARPLRWLAVSSLVVFSLLGVPRFYGGPGWPDALATAQQPVQGSGSGLTVDIWPHGWHMKVPAACLPGQTG